MILEDREFGEILVRRNAWARQASFKVDTSGRLSMTVPKNTPKVMIKAALNASRAQICEKLPVKDPASQRTRDYLRKQLRKQAREYLPYRLEFYAKKYGYQYAKCKLSHANTRWGSCTQDGTITLNIGLMKVPEVLRDYVILHELAHLNHMDHSADFWAEVAEHDPNYKVHRRRLKGFNPGV